MLAGGYPTVPTTAPMPMQRGLALMMILALTLAALLPLVSPPATDAASTDLFFSEYIEGSSNNKALEIYNGTGAPVNLATGAYSVQMFFNGSSTVGLTINLTGTVAAGDVHVIAQSSANAAILAQADQTSGAGWFNGDDAVVLGKGTTVLDVIGQIGIDPGVSGAAGLPAPPTTRCDASRRSTPATRMATNAFDPADEWDGYATDTFDGLGAHSTTSVDAAPTVATTVPANGSSGAAKAADISITFSEPVDVAGDWFDIDCSLSGAHTAVASGGPTAFTLNPDVDFVAGDECTVTISGAAVTDQDADDPPDAMASDYAITFVVGVVCTPATHFIHDVQGSGTSTPIFGSSVTIKGVVVGDYQGSSPTLRGFFVQEEDADADADPLTSEGIFVFHSSTAVEVGDIVSVTGQATEFSNLTQIGSVSNVTVCDTGGSVTPAEITLPVGTTGDWERWEGMLADFTQTMTVTENFTLGRFGEVVLSSTGRQFQGTHAAEPGADALAVAELNGRTRIVLDDANTSQNADPTRYPTGGLSAANTLRIGATVSDLTAIVHEGFGTYRLQPVGEITFDGAADRPVAPPDVGGDLQVAAFNVLNYFNGNGTGGGFPTARGANTATEFERQHDKIVSAIAAMDAEVVGLMEIENDGADTVPAIATLVDGLNDVAGTGTYDYVETGVIGTDEIAVAIIYQPAEVTPTGAFAVLDSSVDARFDDTRNRPALAQSFTETSSGAVFTVAVNHLKSKGSGCGAGDDQPDELGGNCNATRTAAAEALADWVLSDPTGSGDPDSMIIGDLNSYAMETPIDALEDAGYTDLLWEFEGPDAYTYVFRGASGYLDHALASASLTAQVTDAAPWHINTDEPPVLDYNLEFKSPNHQTTLYAADAFRSSDHDPVIVGLDLGLHAKVTGGGRITTDQGIASFELSAKYADHSLTPSGETVFFLPATSFASSDVDWLVSEPDGSGARYGGTGTVNGAPGYGYEVSVTDGPDRLRMRVWELATGTVVFDNGSPLAIRNGQIVVHAK